MDEGVIKFNLHYTVADPPDIDSYTGLNHWRSRLYQHALIGQDPLRYEGYGFGNVSHRTHRQPAPTGQRSFIISGTQTGHLAVLDARHYTTVESYDAADNTVQARGPVKPSSESLTHGMIYDMGEAIQCILHVHSPDIWQRAETLQLPVTDAGVQYGTPAMATEVKRLFVETDVREQRILSMGGHLDGIVSFGVSAREAGEVLLKTLAACK